MKQVSLPSPEHTHHAADILVVDDVPMNLDMLSQMLTCQGYAVRTAPNGRKTLAAVEEKIPDLILLDVCMPEMDGYEICRQLKALDATKDIPVIFISGMHESADKIQGFEVGGLDYIAKPFDRSEVLARVRIHLELHSMQKGLETKVQQHTADLQRSNRALRLISRTNKILVRASDEPSLLQAVCGIMIEVGGFSYCWVGCPPENDLNRLNMAAFASAGNPGNDSAARALGEVGGLECWSCALEAFKNGEPVVVPITDSEIGAEQPWVELARQAGAACCACLPLTFNRRSYAVLTVLADNNDMLGETQIEQLKELCEDIAFGIHTLRERQIHQQALKALAESEQRNRQLFEKAGEAVFLMEAEEPHIGRIIQANQAAARMHGYRVDELIGLSMKVLDTPEAAEGFADRNRRLMAGEWIHEEISHLKKDGTAFITEVSVGSIDIGDQKYLLAFYRDITDRKQIEAENTALEAQIRMANKMEAIGTLASGIAHDFNNILSAASGYTELSIPLVPPDSILSQNLQKIQQANKRAAELVRHILTLSREKESVVQVLQPKLVIREAIKLLRASLPATIEIKQRIESDAYIMGDAAQVHQIIMNLCVNAGHAMEASGGVLTISLADEDLDIAFTRQYVNLQPGHYVVLRVADTGHGIAQQILDKVFDPYFTTKPQGKGTGLGLAVVNGIVNNYRGAIGVESRVDQGSQFTVFLPAVAADQGAAVESGTPIPRGHERILFVDDEPDLVEIGRQLLQLLGYQVTATTGSRQALELFLNNPEAFDLLITDFTMPIMTGSQLAESALNVKPDLPVILMSGLEAVNIESEAKLAGIKGFICKPIVIKEIASLIRELLDT